MASLKTIPDAGGKPLLSLQQGWGCLVLIEDKADPACQENHTAMPPRLPLPALHPLFSCVSKLDSGWDSRNRAVNCPHFNDKKADTQKAQE